MSNDAPSADFSNEYFQSDREVSMTDKLQLNLVNFDGMDTLRIKTMNS